MMREDLRHLIEIQQIDDDIREEKLEQDVLREDLAEKVSNVEDAKATLEDHKERLLELKKEIDRKNLDIKTKDEAIENDRAVLSRITSNKEYKAILTQSEKDKADLSVIEDALLEEMASVDEVAEKVKEETALVEGREAVFAQAEKKAESLIVSSNECVAGLEEKKTTIASGIDPELMGIYTKLSGRGGGKAVVSADGGMCGGCNMTLTSQTISELIKGDEIIRCRMCGRILYLQDEKSS